VAAQARGRIEQLVECSGCAPPPCAPSVPWSASTPDAALRKSTGSGMDGMPSERGRARGYPRPTGGYRSARSQPPARRARNRLIKGSSPRPACTPAMEVHAQEQAVVHQAE
jgi:hypothetical protein